MDTTPIKRAIILNGPPRCGKDTLAAIISEDLGFTIHSFKDTLYDETAKRYGVTREWILTDYEENKDSPHEELSGKTKREALIDTSENHIKVNFGSDYFGVKAAERAAANTMVVFPDGGFESEVGPVSAITETMVLVRITREGKSFEGDSRNYLTGSAEDHFDIVIDISNDGTLDDLRAIANRIAGTIVTYEAMQ